ncbi:hypothetical protein JEQ12_009272 [Ovis aries]|uniref:Antiluteolysin n=2 Tax=Ovis aries TaxID=9940 RepID=A0A836D591_SHEEP|nr:hypothetical protein JEQ12_009272 [Ovis aries]
MVEGGQLQEAQAISVLHEMLQQSFNLFHTERSSAAWDITLLEQLCTGLHQQLDDLDACLGQVMGEEDSTLGMTGPTLALKRYFQGIHVYLKEKEYSDCAWETVRVEIMRSLSSSASLQERKHGIREPTSRFTQTPSQQPSSSRIFPMAFVLSLLMALVLVSYGPGGSLGCDLSQNHMLVGSQNLRILGQMRISSRFCLQDRKDFAFPQEMVEGGQLHEAQAISVLHEMLQQSFNLFHTERASAAWNTTLLEQLRTGLHQQLDDLDACLGQVMGGEDSALGRTGPTLAVKRYFQGIHVYLKEKGYSDCAWDIVRVEIMRSLSSSASLQERNLKYCCGIKKIFEFDPRLESLASENLPQVSTRHRLSQPSSSLIFPMAFVLSLLMALVLVSYGPGGSLGCDLSQNHVLVGRKNLRLLGQMTRLSPHLCLQDRKDFAFPQEMVEGGQLQEAQAISVLHEMLQQSFNLFHTERSSAAWNTTLLKQLRNGLLDQLVDLDACLGQDMGEEDSALGRTGPTLAVKRYFQGIHVYLKEKGYSDCAWETVRVEIMRSLSSSTSLQERLRMMDGDVNSP